MQGASIQKKPEGPVPQAPGTGGPGRGRPRPEASLLRLGRLRERIRRAFLLDGMVALLLKASLLVAGAFLLDYTLVLPTVVRVVLLSASMGYLAWVLLRRVVRPRALTLRDEDLAVLVEAKAPELKQALITAVELSRADHRGARHLSPDLIASVVRKVEERTEAIEPDRVLDLRPVRRNAAFFIGMACLILAGSALRPDLALIWFQRLILLSDRRWPKSTQLELVLPRENPKVISLGDQLVVEARAVRGSPSKVEVEARNNDGHWRDPMIETGEGIYRRVFENVSQPFRFRVRGGDDELAEVEVRVRIEPGLARVNAWYIYPEHTGLAPTPAGRPVSNPSLITVPTGTRVAFRAYTDLPVKRAFLVWKAREEAARSPLDASASRPPGGAADTPADPRPGEGAIPWPEPGARELPVGDARPLPPPAGLVSLNGSPGDAGEARTAEEPLPPPENVASMFDGSFVVERDGLFFFQLLAVDGLPGRRGKVVAVRAIPDRKPVVRIIDMRSSEEVSPEATLPLEFFIRDDYGVRSASLEGVVFDSKDEAGEARSFALDLSARAAPSTPAGADPQPPGGRRTPAGEGKVEHRPRMTLDLKTLPGIAPGARFRYFARAEDFAGQIGESERYVLHVRSGEEIVRLLNERLMLIRDQLREVSRLEESARKDLLNAERDLEAAAAAREGAPAPVVDAPAAARLGRNRQDQERVTAGLTRARKEFDQILGKMEANRVGQDKEKTWISGLREEVQALAGKASPEVEAMIETLRAEASRSPQPTGRIGAIAAEEHRIEREIQMLVLRLTEFGDVNALVQQLRDVKRRQEEIRDRTRNRARGPGGAPPPGEGPAEGPPGEGPVEGSR